MHREHAAGHEFVNVAVVAVLGVVLAAKPHFESHIHEYGANRSPVTLAGSTAHTRFWRVALTPSPGSPVCRRRESGK